jgi:hypothetical protein
MVEINKKISSLTFKGLANYINEENMIRQELLNFKPLIMSELFFLISYTTFTGNSITFYEIFEKMSFSKKRIQREIDQLKFENLITVTNSKNDKKIKNFIATEKMLNIYSQYMERIYFNKNTIFRSVS